MNRSRLMEFKAELILILLTAIWGGTFSLIKGALDYASPLVFVSIRFGIAALILFPFVYKHFKGLNKKQILDGLLIGWWFFPGFILQTVGLQYTTASKSAFITGTFVIFTPIAQMLIMKKLPTLVNTIGIGIAGVGILLLSSGDGDVVSVLSELGSTFNFGDFLTLICAMSFSIYIVYLDVVTKRNNYLYATFSQLAFTTVAALILMPVFHFTGVERIMFKLNNELIFAFIYTIFFATLFNITMMTKYQKEVPPVKAAILYSFEPIFAALIAYILLDERFTTLGFIGAAIIFTGLIITEVFRKEVTVED